MCGGAGGRLAGDGGGCGGEICENCGGRSGFCFGLAFAEDALEGAAREPDEVATGVEVQRDMLGRAGVESEGEGIVAARGQGK